MIRIGVLGTARVVPYGLLEPARETSGVEVTGIASRDPRKAEEFAALHGIRRSFDSYEALLESGDVDAVYIALPTALHHEWAGRALDAGKHVLCEKPLAENAWLAEDLVSRASRLGLVLFEGMHVRFLDRLRRHREMIASGALGKLLRVDSCFRTPYAPMAKDDFRRRFELGGGAALDVGCYAVNCLRYVAGEEPEILSVDHKCMSPQIDRWMRATLRFPSGVEGSVEFGFRGFYLPRDGVVTLCENGRVKWDGKGLVVERNGEKIREALPTKSTYQLQLEAFVKSIGGEESNALPPDDAVLTARVLDDMYTKSGLALRGATPTS